MEWIKYQAFGIDPQHPDPGRVTVRRLNRFEYHNTIHDLLGVDYDTETEFPPDDTGYGFDDIGDVLNLSPMLLEKYLDAAKTIVSKVMPTTSRVMPEKVLAGQTFHRGNAGGNHDYDGGPIWLSYYEKDAVSNSFQIEHAGKYQLVLSLAGTEHFIDDEFDYNKCRLVFKIDGEEMLRKEYVWDAGKPHQYEFARSWPAGEHKLSIEVEPLTPNEKQVRSLALRIDSVTLKGPMDEQYWVAPKNYEHYFPKPVPKEAAARRAYARELLGTFATKAFRRPVDDETLKRLVTLAEIVYDQPGKTFEAGVAEGMVAVLASPRFVFREEGVEAHHAAGAQPLIDEYALASRLSYFLWSSMPDEELFRLAAEKNLRKNLPAQVKRMLADPRSAALVQNFTGQWLQARDIDTVEIDSRAVISRDQKADPDAEHRRAHLHELFNKPTDELTADEKKELAEARVHRAPRCGVERRIAQGHAARDGNVFLQHHPRRPQRD